MRQSIGRHAQIFLIAGLLTACQSPSLQVIPVRFQLDSPATGAINTGGQPPAARSQTASTGTLRISFNALLAEGLKKRRVLATVADVERVVVTVTSGAQVLSQTVERVAIANGQVTATFSGVNTGPVVVTMKAYSSANVLIGEATQSATVATNQATTVNISLVLQPSYTPVTPSGGGSSPQSVGSLIANSTLANGPVFQGTAHATVPTSLQTFVLPALPAGFGSRERGLVVDADARAWVSGPAFVDGSSNEVNIHITPDGTMTQSPAQWSHPFALSPDGGIWALSGVIKLVRADSGSQPVSIRANVISQVYKMAADAHGNCWVAGQINLVSCFAPNGDVIAEFGAPEIDVAISSVAVGPDGDIWMLGPGRLFRGTPSGVVKTAYQLAHAGDLNSDLVVDHDGNVWLTGNDGLHRLTGAGAINRVADVPLGGATSLTVDRNGRVWVWAQAMESVLCFSPDGTLLATYPVVASGDDQTIATYSDMIAASPDGSIWFFADRDKVSRLVP